MTSTSSFSVQPRVTILDPFSPPPSTMPSVETQLPLSTVSDTLAEVSEEEHEQVPTRRGYLKLFFFGEHQADEHLSPKMRRVARIKSMLLMAAIGAALLAFFSSILLWIIVTNQAFKNDEIIRPFYQKTMTALKSDSQLLRLKTGDCADSGFFDGISHYLMSPTKCDTTRSTQKWRLIEDRLSVGLPADYTQSEMILPGGSPCLECYRATANCELVIYSCNDDIAAQKFFIRANVLDVTQKRVYLTLHSKVHPTQCAGRSIQQVGDDSSSRKEEIFKMAVCTGADDQLFYLDIDYNEQFAEKHRK